MIIKLFNKYSRSIEMQYYDFFSWRAPKSILKCHFWWSFRENDDRLPERLFEVNRVAVAFFVFWVRFSRFPLSLLSSDYVEIRQFSRFSFSIVKHFSKFCININVIIYLYNKKFLWGSRENAKIMKNEILDFIKMGYFWSAFGIHP